MQEDKTSQVFISLFIYSLIKTIFYRYNPLPEILIFNYYHKSTIITNIIKYYKSHFYAS